MEAHCHLLGGRDSPLEIKLDDNPFVDKESYVEMLNELDPVTRARLKDGVWTIKRAGNMFKRDWFEVVDVLPQGRRPVRFWDLAATEKTKSNDPDYTAGIKISEYRGIFYIEDFAVIQGRPEAVERLQSDTLIVDGPSIPVREEQEPGSSGVGVVDQKARTIFYGKNYAGIKASGNKIQRAEAASASAERGHIKVARGCRNIELFFEQAETFPSEGYGIHNDLVDAFAHGYNFLGTLPPPSAPEVLIAASGSYWEESNWGEGNWQGWR